NIDDRPSAPQSGSLVRKHLLSVLLTFVEQHAVPVLVAEKVTESALSPTPAREVVEISGV
ncbi:hypothetical protein KIN20_010429, partial [Parelaphostrongylus tenuis]